ncbi:MAG: fused MFS/spermidine synthase [Deltaproteobacteria bacterium]|jgi:spermidine synthase|nr:fused MFS/spermidine synthase [Deltaproteobacteria bacterium]
MTQQKQPGNFSRFIKAFSAGFSQPDPVVVFQGLSEHSRITVRDSGDLRTLYLGEGAHESETSISLTNPLSPIFEYPGMMLMGLAVSPYNSEITMIGLGGGFIPRLFQEFMPERSLTVAEVDPLVREVAETYFFFKPGGNVEVAISDGYEHVSSMPPDCADQIWLDAFNGNYIPEHMTTDGFLELCRSRLKQGGMLVQNLHRTRMDCYRKQLDRTTRIFGGIPLVFAGKKSANAVLISSRQDDEPWTPPGAKEVVRLAREFGPVGPYSLANESLKRVNHPEMVL